jgi:hypothetical protein
LLLHTATSYSIESHNERQSNYELSNDALDGLLEEDEDCTFALDTYSFQFIISRLVPDLKTLNRDGLNEGQRHKVYVKEFG